MRAPPNATARCGVWRCCRGMGWRNRSRSLRYRWRAAAAVASRREEVPSQMKKDRSGESNRVKPIQHSAVTLNEAAPIFDAAVTLDRRHHQSAEKTHHGDDQRHTRRLPSTKRCDLPKTRPESGGT